MRRTTHWMLLFALMLLAPACATRNYEQNSLTASGTALINRRVEPAQARREAIQLAMVRARDNLMFQVLAMRMTDGRTLEQAAVKDPYVAGMLRDAVRASRPQGERRVTETSVELTMRMELGPVQKLIRNYPTLAR